MASAPTVGVLMLDTRFPRLVGDIGNPDSFEGSVLFRVIDGASAQQAVRGDPSGFLAAFVDAGLMLVDEGAQVITTSCGFLSLFQSELARALPVPVATTSLMQVPAVEAKFGRAGILTIDAEALSPAHLEAVGVREDIAIAGLPADGSLATMIFGDLPTIDPLANEAEMVAASRRLMVQESDLAAIVLECTNMGPYAKAVSAATGVPVFSILDAVKAAWGGQDE